MTSERSPLISRTDEDDPYTRFSPSQKSFILAQLSCCGLLPFFVSGTFVPSIPQIAKDVGADPATVGVAVGISIAATSLGGFVAASYTTIYGRRTLFLTTLPIVVLGSLGVACSQSAFQLLFWRFVQSFAASPGRILGPVVLGDIYKVEERGLAYGIFLSVSLLGCAAAPPLDGIIAYYSSWRITQCVIGILGLVAFTSMALFLPETKWDTKEKSNESKYLIARLWKSVWLLRSPVLSLSAVASATALLTDYALLVPFAYTIVHSYFHHSNLPPNLNNSKGQKIQHNQRINNRRMFHPHWTRKHSKVPSLPSLLLTSNGPTVASPLTGRLSDKIIIRNRKKRGGKPYPEDRLYLAFIGSLIPVPLSIVCSGLITSYIDGWVGLVLNLVCLLVNGIGVAMSLSPATAYSVDVLQSQSANSVAATWGLRSLVVSLAISCVIPSIETFGLLATNVGIGIAAWMGAGIYYLLLRYGDELRGCVDVGYNNSGL